MCCQIKVSAGFTNINAENGMTLCGFMGRQEPCNKADGNLEANALIIKQGDVKIVIVSLDLLYVGLELRQKILVNLNGALTDSELLLCASHTHFAPSVDITKPSLGKFDSHYLELVVYKVTTLLKGLLCQGSEPAYVSYRKVLSFKGIISRRRMGWGLKNGILRRMSIMAPNKSAEIDKSIRVLRITSAKGATLALLWNISCHPTEYPVSMTASPEYPGAVREILRKGINKKLPIIFLQGFSGDVKPNFTTFKPNQRNRRSSIKNWINKKINAPLFESPSLKDWEKWVNDLGNSVVAAEKDTKKLDIDLIKGIRATISTKKLGLQTSIDISMHLIKIGKIILVGISAEPVNDYVSLIESLFPNNIIIPVGYTDHVYGYLPSSKMLKEHGYEVDGFMKYFNIEGKFSENIDEIVLEELQKIVS